MKRVISLVTMLALVVSIVMSMSFVVSGNNASSNPGFVYGGEGMSATEISDSRFAIRMSHTAGQRKYMYYSERVNVNDLTIVISQMNGYHDFINIMLVGGSDITEPKAFGDANQPLGLDWHMHCTVVNNVLNSDNMLTCDVANTAGTGVFGNLPIRSAGSANQPIAISLKKEDDGKWYKLY